MSSTTPINLMTCFKVSWDLKKVELMSVVYYKKTQSISQEKNTKVDQVIGSRVLPHDITQDAFILSALNYSSM